MQYSKFSIRYFTVHLLIVKEIWLLSLDTEELFSSS